MDILPAHVAILISVEKYMVLAFQDYQHNVSQKEAEPPLDFLNAKHLGVACLMTAALEKLFNDQEGTERDDVLYVLPHLLEIPFITDDDLEPIKQTFWTMNDFKAIREDVSLSECIGERAWWAAYLNNDYSLDAALARYIGGLFTALELWRDYEMMCIEVEDQYGSAQ